MTSQSREWQQLWENLENPENRRELATEIATSIAFQIRHLREKAGWTQAELANRTEKEQPTISQLEDPNYGRYSLVTLKTLANAFDVALSVRFVPFSELVDWLANLTPEKLAPPSYSEEQEKYWERRERALMPTLANVSFALSTDNTHDGEWIEEQATYRAIQSQRHGNTEQGGKTFALAA